ncbi:suppressor of fused domain protein [Actinoplanes sp. HUAS TT8]|uniref:suppressor of fused domain protein n=1 Tax=Actinoplanes sp. HUAS TT8 TaxID=3447453 RepID=UPI003F522ED6
MAAPAVLRDVFLAHQKHWGEEDGGFLFEDPAGPLPRIDVLIYRPTARIGLTSFTTIGMAGRPMPSTPGPGASGRLELSGPGGSGRAELQFSRRGALTERAENEIARQLANLAVHPFRAGTQLDWGHLIGLGQEFPTFPGCHAVFLSGPLTENARDYIRTVEGPVRILNVIPITDQERDLGRALPPLDFVQTLLQRVDILAERPS